MIKGKQEKEEG